MTYRGRRPAVRRTPAEFQKLCARIVELREQGWTLKRIGDDVGLCRDRVRQYLDRTVAEREREAIRDAGK